MPNLQIVSCEDSMFNSLSDRWLPDFLAAAAMAALVSLSPVAAVAAPAPASMPSDSGAAPASVPTALNYKSAFEGYQPFADEKPIPWKEANETVYRRGGWQAYAKEASGSGAANAESPDRGTSAPAAHSGHTMAMPGMPGMPGMSGAPAKKEKP
jgi:hypothetical protein